MLKRQAVITALCLCLVLAAIIPVSVSAAESDLSNNGWYDALDYGTLIDSSGNPVDNSYFELNGYYPFGVDLPTENTLYAADILLSIDGNVNYDQMEIQFVNQTSGAYANLEIIPIGSNLYRVFGDVPDGSYTSFDIRFWNHDGNTYKINVLSLNVSIAEITFFKDIGSVTLQSSGGSSSATMSSVNSSAALVQYWATSTPYTGTVSFNTWRRYDYVDFFVGIDVDSISSISASDTYGNFIPFTVNYLSDNSGVRSFIRIRLDLTGMDKTMDVTNVYYPYIQITGEATGEFSLSLKSVVGHVVVPAPDEQVYWWNTLFNKLGEWFGGLTGSLESGMNGALESEKNEANNQGNGAVGDMENAIPDYGQAFTDSLQTFSASFSYDGTDAVLPIPGIVIPEIPGLIPQTELWAGVDLDFGQYLNLLPEWLILLVQSLLTIALIVFCFKELYDTISYILTLRKGGA